MAIAESVTAMGRDDIMLVKKTAETMFPDALVVYGDTDSVFVRHHILPHIETREAVEEASRLTISLADAVNEQMKYPKKLEFEKVYMPYILYSKKRYAGQMYTTPEKPDKIDIKGLQLVRRDNVPFVRETSKEILDIILESNNPESARELARQRAVELLDGRVSMEKLTLSQKLADSYKNPNLAHVMVRDKMRKREPGSEPQSGDRVRYVIVTDPTTDKQCEKAEDPVWVEKMGLKLDYQYYFTNKFINPVSDLLEPLVKNASSAIFGDLIAKKIKRIKCSVKMNTIESIFTRYKVKQEELKTQ